MRFLAKFLLLVVVTLMSGCDRGGALDLPGLEGRARGGDAAALEQLVDLLGEPTLANRIYPVILDIGDRAAPALLARVATSDAQRREYVIAALGTLRVKDAAAPIAAVLADRRLERRYVAARALGELGDPAGVPALIGALDDENAEVRRTATRALVRIHRAAVDPLVAALPGAAPRAAAGMIRALGDIGDRRALEALLVQAEGPCRAEALLALGRLRDPRAEATLIAGLADADWQVRVNAAMALGPMGGPATAQALQANLDDEVTVVREWAARSLETITGKPQLYRNGRGELVPPENLYR